MTTDNVFSTYDLMSDLAANRPATPTVANGRLSVFMATDTGVVSIWNGSAWADLPTGLTYTTGAWTPGMTFGGTPATVTSSGIYVKVGKLAFVSGGLTLTNKNGGAGTANITNFPFACNSVQFGLMGAIIGNITLPTNYSTVRIFVNISSTNGFFSANGSGQAATNLTDTAFSTSPASGFNFSGSYITT